MATPSDIFSFSTDPNGSSDISSLAELRKLDLSLSLGISAIIKDWDAVSQPVRGRWVLSIRTELATGGFWAHGYDVQTRNTASKPDPSSWLCCHCIQQKVHKPKVYVSSNTRKIEGHLSKAHNLFNPDPLKVK
ncbi:hypothetical protein FOXG_22565 [Fusarium oxysporum f. sp. lycopersici 4287]|uniref:BED-type domain-containing protein n=1 Tax=Fusarium oxysporum f. sp. lycopersici (strain 4287 / CBS 123668 / FGSC 9935 / NRRL 34936) TaxID=426428 RepID=A0A0J9W899_FUSO4|nr:hypothetical protein FOXG_22538 [Fusarium oxysporum f. sp. lycopersici 4287]XP_018257489.1 hypothetical protein FOXG_22565 [Fusarium oxysporum f. sp. lycopersici 4287]KNB19362.1 hypothetical protein FOXG_22538 [Fusarium oxysporum f. sp. lycopersici 4287]KNB19444.1 hypothetical protein FOXG_22565 [Fusarium oxysporum f. sp. lycopersici 4287]